MPPIHPEARRPRLVAILLVLCALAGGSPAQAQPLGQRLRDAIGRALGRPPRPRTPEELGAARAAAQPQACQARLLQTAESQGWKHEMKGNLLYVVVPPSGAKQYLQACGPNVIEFWKAPRNGHTYHHLYTRLDKTNWSRIWSLSSSSWYPPSEGIGVLSALEPSVAQRTQQFLEDNRRNPTSPTNRWGTIGSFNVGGGGGGPSGTSHCTNYWECAKVGEAGETMPQLHGQSWTGIAPGWISGLMRSASPPVFAVVVYGGTSDFNTSLGRFFE